MSTSASSLERIHRALTVPTRGIFGLVDELLAVSCDHSLRLVRMTRV